jgi:hypothetical protein
MKVSKLFSVAAIIAVSVLTVFYGCKKYDDFSNPNSSKKDFAYFKTTMSKDENLQGFYSEIKQMTWLISYRIYANNKLAAQRSINSNLTPSELKRKFSQLFEDTKNVKTEEQFVAFQSKLGLSGEGSAILAALNNEKKRIQRFVEENPEFKQLAKDQQKELLNNAIRQIRLDKKNTLVPTQETTASECISAYEQDQDGAETDFAFEVGIIYAAMVACVVVTEGTGVYVCYEAAMAATALAEAHLVYQTSQNVYYYNVCMASVPEQHRSL